MISFSDTLMYLQYYRKTAYLTYLKVFKDLDYTGRIESHNPSLRGYEGCYPIKSLLNKMHITDGDRVLDIGCGKGLALYYLSMYAFERIDGIEYSGKLTRVAKSNLDILKDNRIHVYHCDAREFMHYDKYNYYFINNPFSVQVMQQVILAIIRSCSTKKRRVTVLYQFPYSIDEFTKHGFKVKCNKYPNAVLTFG